MYHNFFIYLSVDQHLGYFHVLAIVTEKAVAPHSSTLAQKIPWTEEPGGLQSMESQRVGHDWVTSLSLFTFMHWRRKWQLTPGFLPGESQGRGEPDGLPSMGSHRVRHDWSDLAAAAAVCIYVSATLSIHATFFFRCVYKSVLYIWVPVPSQQIDSSVPSFQIPYICINIQY